jgi:hypothetical protein
MTMLYSLAKTPAKIPAKKANVAATGTSAKATVIPDNTSVLTLLALLVVETIIRFLTKPDD